MLDICFKKPKPTAGSTMGAVIRVSICHHVHTGRLSPPAEGARSLSLDEANMQSLLSAQRCNQIKAV